MIHGSLHAKALNEILVPVYFPTSVHSKVYLIHSIMGRRVVLHVPQIGRLATAFECPNHKAAFDQLFAVIRSRTPYHVWDETKVGHPSSLNIKCNFIKKVHDFFKFTYVMLLSTVGAIRAHVWSCGNSKFCLNLAFICGTGFDIAQRLQSKRITTSALENYRLLAA